MNRYNVKRDGPFKRPTFGGYEIPRDLNLDLGDADRHEHVEDKTPVLGVYDRENNGWVLPD